MLYQIDDKIEEFAKAFLDMVEADQEKMAAKCRTSRKGLLRNCVRALSERDQIRLLGRMNLNLIGHGAGSRGE
jgi:hypothetical protein